jgi:hypothetical protein
MSKNWYEMIDEIDRLEAEFERAVAQRMNP